MEKARLIAIGLHVCRWYLIVFHVLFALWVGVVFLACLFDGTSIKDYCIPVKSGESYDILWEPDVLCRINWQVLFKEVFAVSLIVYIVFSGPVWIARFVLGRKSSVPEKIAEQ